MGQSCCSTRDTTGVGALELQVYPFKKRGHCVLRDVSHELFRTVVNAVK